MIHLKESEIARITHYLNIKATTDRADLAFIFGTSLYEPVRLATDLFHTGTVSLIVVTGGYNPRTKIHEAMRHQQLLLDANVPAASIIVESQSTNTLENVTMALPLIMEHHVPNLQSVITIAKWFHCRRAIMTLKRHFPDLIRYYTCTYNPSDITPENWHQSQETAQPVLHNWHSIPRYVARGHLTEIEYIDGAFQ